MSIHSKASSSKSRINWQSFTKSYRYYFQSAETTWSKYQISAMSLEQIMALRKLALIQFSKLVERQHSNMIRKLRLFSKKLSATEFQKAYDSIDSVNGNGQLDRLAKANSFAKDSESGANKLEAAEAGSAAAAAAATRPVIDQVVIDSKKVSHQLGAQMGMYPSTGVTKKMADAATPVNASLAGRKKRKSSFKRAERQQQLQASHGGSYAQNYSTVSNEESSSSIVLDYDYVNLSSNQTSQLETRLLAAAVAAENCSSSSSSQPSVNAPAAAVVSALVPTLSRHVLVARPSMSAKVSRLKTFSLPLNVIMQLSGQPLPQQILEAMRLVRRAAPNEVGIFRKNGNKARINKIKELIDKNESVNFQTSDLSIFDIADTIKLYFRELPECLITNKLSNILLSNYTSKEFWAHFLFIYLFHNIKTSFDYNKINLCNNLICLYYVGYTTDGIQVSQCYICGHM